MPRAAPSARGSEPAWKPSGSRRIAWASSHRASRIRAQGSCGDRAPRARRHGCGSPSLEVQPPGARIDPPPGRGDRRWRDRPRRRPSARRAARAPGPGRHRPWSRRRSTVGRRAARAPGRGCATAACPARTVLTALGSRVKRRARDCAGRSPTRERRRPSRTRRSSTGSGSRRGRRRRPRTGTPCRRAGAGPGVDRWHAPGRAAARRWATYPSASSASAPMTIASGSLTWVSRSISASLTASTRTWVRATGSTGSPVPSRMRSASSTDTPWVGGGSSAIVVPR